MKHIKLFENYTNITLESLTNNLTTIDVPYIISLLNEIDVEYPISKLNKIDRRSEELSKVLNMKGLVGDWKYPFNTNFIKNEFLIASMKEFWRFDNIDDIEIEKLFDIYAKLNPIIKNIPTKVMFDKYYIIMGMTSGYNYDDIYDFVTIGGFDKRDDIYLNKHKEVTKTLGIDLQYVPSEKTLDNILSHLNSNENIAYHGSPYNFDEFSSNMIGSGEGASGFGYGFYFSENIDDAKDYARKLERNTGEGILYKVRIPKLEKFLNIDNGLNYQSEYVKKCLLSLSDKHKIKILTPYNFDYLEFKQKIDNEIDNGEYDVLKNSEEYNEFLKDILDTEFMNIGNNFFSLLEEIYGDDYNASKILSSIGIKGNIHKGFGYVHYVVFDENDIEIMKKTKPRLK
jgi:hypothetical protein